MCACVSMCGVVCMGNWKTGQEYHEKGEQAVLESLILISGLLFAATLDSMSYNWHTGSFDKRRQMI